MMNYKHIPVSFFPSSVLIIDDNRRFLRNLSLQLDENCAYLLFDNPQKAIEHLENINETRSLLNNYSSINLDHCGNDNQYSVNIELASIHKQIYNQQRFEEVSVVVVDYAMPAMNGIQFCEKLYNRRVKKIMLTAEADHQIALEAFNNGIIDKFIFKSDFNLKKTLNESILELQKKFFYELTDSVSHSIEKEPGYCLTDPKIVTLFEKICRENAIVEYHLLNSSGDFLLLDAYGKPSWFIIKIKSELEMYHDIAIHSEAPKHLCEQIETAEKIPFFPSLEGLHKVIGNDWENYLYPATAIIGKEPYYYSFLTEIKDNVLNKNQLFSYQDYLESLSKKNVNFLRSAVA